MSDSLSPEQLEVWTAFMRTHSSLMRRLERQLQDDHGIPLTYYDVLVHLSDAPANRLTHGTLGERVLLTRSGITRVVDRMLAAGLVRRESSAEDRRQSYVVMTAQGRAALDNAGPEHAQSVYEQFGKHLRADETAAFLSFFERVLGDEDSEKANRRTNAAGRKSQSSP